MCVPFILSITDAHRIVFLDHGRVLESGTHAQLLAADGPYVRAWRLQQREERVEDSKPSR